MLLKSILGRPGRKRSEVLVLHVHTAKTTLNAAVLDQILEEQFGSTATHAGYWVRDASVA